MATSKEAAFPCTQSSFYTFQQIFIHQVIDGDISKLNERSLVVDVQICIEPLRQNFKVSWTKEGDVANNMLKRVRSE